MDLNEIKNDIKDTIPSDTYINSISPGALAIERFKLAMTLDGDDEKTTKLRETLLEKDQ
ncbi:MAG: hypothetical protein ACOYVD_15615 [Bacillota bacterium]